MATIGVVVQDKEEETFTLESPCNRKGVVIFAMGDCTLYSTVMLVVSMLEEFGNSTGTMARA
jgi:precorrin-2 methylase